MSESGRFTTHHVADTGVRYAPGDIVRVDQSAAAVGIVKDPNGDYEVFSCRPATEYGSDPPLLRVSIRKRQHRPVETHEWSSAEPEPTPDWLKRPRRT